MKTKISKSITIENKKAYHDYFILESLECGIELKGHEVKSIRCGMCSLKDAWCVIKDNQLYLTNSHITRYDTMMDFDVNERRDRRLLAHKHEIKKLASKLIDNGITLIPLKMYFTNGKCKILIGLAKGKHTYDKRETLKNKQQERDIQRTLAKY